MIILGEINRKGICLKLGKRGEHNVTFFQFDYTEWEEKYGEGTLSLRLTQHGASTAYPVTLEYDGTIATYTVTKTDTSVAGDGKAEFVYIVGEEEKIKKSVTYETYVEPSEDTGEAPDPYDDWLAHLEVLAGEVVQAKDDAEQAAESARQSSISAQRSEENAARSEQNAEEYAERIENLTVSAHEASGTTPTATKTIIDDVYNIDFGLVRGEKGNKGDKGDTGNDGITPDISIGEVKTLNPSEDAYVTNTGTKENPVFDFGIPKGETGEVSMEDFLKVAVTDTASGSGVVTIPDGANLPMKSLKVTLTPQQDGTPWIGTDHDTAPYLNRAMPTQSNDYNRETDMLVGGTVAWNQLARELTSEYWSARGYESDATISDGIFSCIATSQGGGVIDRTVYRSKRIANHVYFQSATIWLESGTGVFRFRTMGGYGDLDCNATSTPTVFSRMRKAPDDGNLDISIMDRRTENFTKMYVKSIMVFDLTAMFGSTIADYIYSLEQATAGAGVAWFRKYFQEDYYPYSANTLQSVQATAHKTYDGDGNVIGNYALDSSLTLRGIPKLDANNNLYYDGDTYASDGTVNRRFGIVDLGTLSWARNTTNQFYTTLPTASVNNTTKMIANGYIASSYGAYNNNVDRSLTVNGASGARLWCRDTRYDDLSSFVSAMSGVYLVYELATPTTETAQAYTSPQIVDPDGTEEYVTANSVPVGHDSTYSLVCPISGYDEVGANVVGKNLFGGQYGVRFSVFIPANTAFTASAKHTGGSARIDYFDADGNRIDWFGLTSGSERDTRTITSTEDVHSVLFTGTETTEYQIELGSTATDYEPYQGQTYTADLPQTVYGGTVDLVTGEVVIDRAIVTLDGSSDESLNVTPLQGFTQVGWGGYISIGKPLGTFVCDTFAFEKNGNSYITGLGRIWGGSVPRCFMGFPTTVTDVASARQWLSEHPTTIVYKLATPQTYQLTPQVIEALKGVNNLWSNGDSVYLHYVADTGLFIIKKIDEAINNG